MLSVCVVLMSVELFKDKIDCPEEILACYMETSVEISVNDNMRRWD